MKALIQFPYRILLAVVSRLRWLPPLLARISVGTVFVESGWGKLHNLEKVTEFFQKLGIPFAKYQAPFVGATELVCGLLLVFGIAARFATVPLILIMTVAVLTAKLQDLSGVTDLFTVYEYLYAVLLFWLLVEGPGALALDEFMSKGKKGKS